MEFKIFLVVTVSKEKKRDEIDVNNMLTQYVKILF